MPNYTTESIRSVALVGHGGAGKTTLTETLLLGAGAIKVKGSVEKGSTVCDYDPQEKSAGHSLQSALVNFAYEGVHIHLIDTPGYPDFSGQAIAALAGVDTALVVINAQTGIELATTRMMNAAAARGLARMIVINKIDADSLDLPRLVAAIQAQFGKHCLVLDLPAHDRHDMVNVLAQRSGDSDFDSVANAHRALIDQIIEEDETLMARYLEDDSEPSAAELHGVFEQALRSGHLVPIVFVSAKTGAGIPELLHTLATLAPNPLEGNKALFFRGARGADAAAYAVTPDPALHVVAHVFKVISDPYMGKVSVFRVHQGTVKKDTLLYVGDAKKPVKVSHLYQLQGKEFVEVATLMPGDLGAIAKIDEIDFDCVLHDSHDEDHIHLRPLEFPKPMQGLAVDTKRQVDEQRLFDILHKLEIEDPCFEVERHPTTHETVIRGLGDMHLRYKLEKMATQHKLELLTRPPSIPYRETVTQNAEGHCRHKKQSGGAGQFGEVFLRVEPLPRGAGLKLVDQVKGGVIPTVFMPAVEKGVRRALADGVVGGYPVEDICVIVYDGKHHAVDSKEVAFFSAARKALVAAIRAAAPIILEPVVHIEIGAPESAMGEITGDLASRRGHVTSTNGSSGGLGMSAVAGETPLAELSDYASRLKSMTSGQGSYSITFSHHAPVPPATQAKLAAAFKLHEDEE